MEYLITAKYPEGFPPVSDLIREHEIGERVQELVRQGYWFISLESAQLKMHLTLGESSASDSESTPAPKQVI